MTVDAIYSEIANHMIEGMMFHEQMANYYDFLGLEGYKRCHEYHYIDETCAYRCICRYYINHHNKLIEVGNVDDPKVIPDSWYRYSRSDVDSNTKKNAVKNGLTLWLDWERETKSLYQNMYKELIDIGEVASANKINCLVCDVDKELKKVERYMLNKKATDFDMSSIIGEQKHMHSKYRDKEQSIGIHIC